MNCLRTNLDCNTAIYCCCTGDASVSSQLADLHKKAEVHSEYPNGFIITFQDVLPLSGSVLAAFRFPISSPLCKFQNRCCKEISIVSSTIV